MESPARMSKTANYSIKDVNMNYYPYKEQGLNITIYYYVSLGVGKRVRGATNEIIPSEQFWSKKSKRATVPASDIAISKWVPEIYENETDMGDEVDVINTNLDKLERFVSRQIRQLKKERVANIDEVLKPRIADYLGKRSLDKEVTVISFMDSINEFINFQVEEAEFSNATIRDYRRSKKLLQEYATFKGVTLDFDSITLTFYSNYKNFLKTKKSMAPNTIGKHIKILKTFLNDSLTKGYHSNKQFQNRRFKTIKIENVWDYLTVDEVKQVRDLKLTGDDAHARDWWLISAITAQRGGDVMRWTTKNLKTYDGVEMLEFKESKNNKERYIEITPELKPLLFPPKEFTKQEINEAMGRVMKQLGSKKKITFHSGRRSEISQMSLAGDSIAEIMAVSFHATEKSTRTYISSSGKDVVIASKKRREKLARERDAK